MVGFTVILTRDRFAHAWHGLNVTKIRYNALAHSFIIVPYRRDTGLHKMIG